MDLIEEFLEENGYAAVGWETDGMGMDSMLVCPHGTTIEQDGRCPQGCVSPLRTSGLI